MLFHYADLHAPSLCRLLTTTTFILSWRVASSSTMPLLLTIILSCLHALSLCRPACSFTMQAFNHNFYIVMEHGKFFYYATLLLTIILSCLHALSLCRPACSFTMQAFNHNNFYIVMESGKFFYYATFVDNYFVMSACSFHYADLHAPSLCRLLTTTTFILSWRVASSSTMPLLLTIILSCLHAPFTMHIPVSLQNCHM